MRDRTVQVPYGNTFFEYTVPTFATVVEPDNLPDVGNEHDAVRAALENPIGSSRLREIAAGKRTATIVINDITRPSPSELFVEAILEELQVAGIDDDGVTILVATGNHRPNTRAELEKMLSPDLVNRLRIVNHDGSENGDLVNLGTTTRGVPVDVNRLVVDADVTIITGNIGPHQTAGFSGGRKSIMPGVASHFALRTHHSYPVRSLSPVMGELENNSFHDEAVEAARIVGVDFMINSVRNIRGEIVAIVAGDLEEAHLTGVKMCKAAWQVTVEKPADISLVSAGGYPKDIDLHQAQKAVASAELITREGGPIIVVAECSDGTGKFANALINAGSPQEVVDRFLSEGFEADEHTSKAYLYARAALKHPLFLVSQSLPAETINQMFMTCFTSIEDAVEAALPLAGESPTMVIAPHAVDCLFSVRTPA